jgi:hypothetical protein
MRVPSSALLSMAIASASRKNWFRIANKQKPLMSVHQAITETMMASGPVQSYEEKPSQHQARGRMRL